METLKDIGELAAIERICRRLPARRDVVLGAGDDCAVVRACDGAADDWVLTSDPVICGTHFTPEAAPRDIGRKAVGRVLSDMAAMGAEPRWGLIDIVAPSATPVATLDDVYAGVLETAERHGFTVVGGDMAEGPVLELHVFGIGVVPRGRAVLRSGARPGDQLFVTGSLGGSSQGRHLLIEPRLREGLWLRDWASAMIDVSDGLASDIRHVTALSRTGCDLNTARIPISAAALGAHDGVSPLDHALHDGEDFELLFTVSGQRCDAMLEAWRREFQLPCTRIGLMTAHADLVRCVSADGEAFALEGTGYAHYRRAPGRRDRHAAADTVTGRMGVPPVISSSSGRSV